jgi:hypothetical protein
MKKGRFFAEPVLSGKTRFFTEFILSAREWIRMTDEES